MAKKTAKTNAMRQLDEANIFYQTCAYQWDEKNFDGELVAEKIGLPAGQVFKTLVVEGEHQKIAVCCIPVDCKIDFKRLAAATGCKRLALVALERIFALTGYVRGGCSPIGMKKQYPTYIDQTALQYDTIAVSAGVRGTQLLLAPQALIAHIHGETGDFVQRE